MVASILQAEDTLSIEIKKTEALVNSTLEEKSKDAMTSASSTEYTCGRYNARRMQEWSNNATCTVPYN